MVPQKRIFALNDPDEITRNKYPGQQGDAQHHDDLAADGVDPVQMREVFV